MNEWIPQHRPAPHFEQVVPAPAAETPDLPDLGAMARTLDEMKIEARVDAERTRPGLNGFLAFVVVTSVVYVVGVVQRYGREAFSRLVHTSPLQVPAQAAVALGAGLLVAGAVALASYLAERRTRRAVAAFEQQLISLGGTPLPERGLALRGARRTEDD